MCYSRENLLYRHKYLRVKTFRDNNLQENNSSNTLNAESWNYPESTRAYSNTNRFVE